MSAAPEPRAQWDHPRSSQKKLLLGEFSAGMLSVECLRVFASGRRAKSHPAVSAAEAVITANRAEETLLATRGVCDHVLETPVPTDDTLAVTPHLANNISCSDKLSFVAVGQIGL